MEGKGGLRRKEERKERRKEDKNKGKERERGGT